MRLSDLTSDTKKIAVAYKVGAKEFAIKIEYKTQAVTLAFISDVHAREGMSKVVYQVEKVLVGWDLTDDNDKVIPVTGKAIESAGVPVYLLTSILDAIAQDRFVLTDDSKNA